MNAATQAMVATAITNLVAENLHEVAAATGNQASAEAKFPVQAPTPMAVQGVANQMLTQDPLWKSKRLWAAILGGLAVVLMDPTIQGILGVWAPMLSGSISALLAAWSKQEDVRPFA